MTIEAKRIEKTNQERFQLAQQWGWQFQPEAPQYADAWQVLPFTQRGDQRIAFGVVNGQFNGVPFLTFDFHRRPKVTHYHDAWTDRELSSRDTVTIDTVWAVKLPMPMPFFQVASSIDPAFDVDPYPEPQTPDGKFNRWYKLIDTDPNIAAYYLHPQLMKLMRDAKLHTWAVVGDDLLFMEHPIFGRTKPDEIVETLGKLLQLVNLFPFQAFANGPQR
ncbi:hypothetical protein [Kribbella sp. NPDC004875]|uniref:hypothetical protein n=1 Tax=Kribbella sp. NPDC004875 TaxID=3364107 RepID=UPI0036ADE4B7